VGLPFSACSPAGRLALETSRCDTLADDFTPDRFGAIPETESAALAPRCESIARLNYKVPLH
jgi:hypothetical protein